LYNPKKKSGEILMLVALVTTSGHNLFFFPDAHPYAFQVSPAALASNMSGCLAFDTMH
jgi:hypothetical protein